MKGQESRGYKYSVRQNSLYALKIALAKERLLVWFVAVNIFLAVAVQVTAIFLPRTVVAQILGEAELRALVVTILAFGAAALFFWTISEYFGTMAHARSRNLRFWARREILAKVITTDFANVEDQNFLNLKGKALATSEGDAGATEQIYKTLQAFGINVFGFVVYVVLLAAINPLIMLLVAATAFFGVLARKWANKWRFANDDFEAASLKRIRYITRIGQDYSLAKDVRIFTMIPWLQDIYETNMRLAHNFAKKAQKRQLVADIVDAAAAFIREGVAYAYLIWQVLFGGMAVADFVLMFAAIGGFSVWVSGIFNEYGQLSRHSLAYCRFREYLEYPDKFKREDGESFAPEQNKSYELELKNVSFRYVGANEDTLQNINLKIAPGEKLALLGLNGAGKTTMVKLLCGFYDPTEGQVLLNGKDIRDYNRREYYNLFTAVFQEFNILPLSVGENVSQRVWDESDHERVKKCMELAGIFDKIETLPQKAETRLLREVNEGAAELSGGETQKLMLARALYKDSPVLILDEPTAALDPIAESELYNRYSDLCAGKTSIFISHRMASTRFCDRIILLDGKIIAETGTHEELLAKNGKYAELFEIQSKYYREDFSGGEAV